MKRAYTLGRRVKKVCTLGRQVKRASTSGRRKKGAGTSEEKTEEFMLSPELPSFSAKEKWPAKIECTAGEKGVLHRLTVNETML
jgi:hypothetical protein